MHTKPTAPELAVMASVSTGNVGFSVDQLYQYERQYEVLSIVLFSGEYSLLSQNLYDGVLQASFAIHTNILPSLVINSDQTGLPTIPSPQYTRASKGSKDVSVNGYGEKRQITVTPSNTAAGESLPLQVQDCPLPCSGYVVQSRQKVQLNINKQMSGNACTDNVCCAFVQSTLTLPSCATLTWLANQFAFAQPLAFAPTRASC
jgi:hypothetical protein